MAPTHPWQGGLRQGRLPREAGDGEDREKYGLHGGSYARARRGGEAARGRMNF